VLLAVIALPERGPLTLLLRTVAGSLMRSRRQRSRISKRRTRVEGTSGSRAPAVHRDPRERWIRGNETLADAAHLHGEQLNSAAGAL